MDGFETLTSLSGPPLLSNLRSVLRDKVTLRLLKLYFYIADLVAGQKAKRLVLLCISNSSKILF